MTPEDQKKEVQETISAIKERNKSLYYIALQMSRHTSQIKRMYETGRCQFYELVMLKEILLDVSRETVQNVTTSSATMR
jgi:hypothetical protein